MLLPRPLSKSQRLFLRTGARCGCTQSVGSLGSLQGFACPSVLGCKRPFSVLAGVPHMSQLQSLLEDTSCPGSDIEDRFQHMAPEGRHPHRTFSSKTNAYQPPHPTQQHPPGLRTSQEPKADRQYIHLTVVSPSEFTPVVSDLPPFKSRQLLMSSQRWKPPTIRS